MSLGVAFIHIAYTGAGVYNQEFWGKIRANLGEREVLGPKSKRSKGEGPNVQIMESLVFCHRRTQSHRSENLNLLDPMLSAVRRFCLCSWET